MAPIRGDRDNATADLFDLDAIAKHNASVGKTEFPSYHEAHKGLGIYQDRHFLDDLDIPPTPCSIPERDGVRTRSGRSTGRKDSPFSSSGKSRNSKSPASRPKKVRKSKVLEKAKTPKLTAPLSVLTKDLKVPVKDVESWVNRPSEVRQQEAGKRQGYITRPMNAFMLYRSAYADRVKEWATQNNHQVVSSVSGESWGMEPEEVKAQFIEWSKIDRANHAAAHPNYKFSPSKAKKGRKDDLSSDDEDGSDLDGDPDGEYRAGGRGTRQRRQRATDADEMAYLNSTVGFDSNPYYSQHGYEMPQYGYTSNGRILPSNVTHDTVGLAYDPQTGTYVQTHVVQQHPANYTFVQDVRMSTPASQQGGQSLGGFGIPGQMSSDDMFGSSRTGTPAMHHYGQYAQVAYPAYTYAAYQPQSSAAQQQQLYEHQQYLQAASEAQAIDPELEAAFVAGTMGAPDPFDDTLGHVNGEAPTFVGIPEYSFEDTLAPRWEPTSADFAGY